MPERGDEREGLDFKAIEEAVNEVNRTGSLGHSADLATIHVPALLAENARLRGVLEEIAYGLYGDWQAHEIASEQSELARAALADKQPEPSR